MKKLSALVTTIILGTAGVAAAAPRYNAPSHTAQFRPAERPSQYHQGYQRWMLLDGSASLRGGREVINVDTNMRFSKLKLEATRGTASIDKVLVTFGNGRTQVIEVDQRLGGRGSSSTIVDLSGVNGRQIKSIVIYGQGGRMMRGASLSVSAA